MFLIILPSSFLFFVFLASSAICSMRFPREKPETDIFKT